MLIIDKLQLRARIYASLKPYFEQVKLSPAETQDANQAAAERLVLLIDEILIEERTKTIGGLPLDQKS